jgi:hypothetical protein
MHHLTTTGQSLSTPSIGRDRQPHSIWPSGWRAGGLEVRYDVRAYNHITGRRQPFASRRLPDGEAHCYHNVRRFPRRYLAPTTWTLTSWPSRALFLEVSSLLHTCGERAVSQAHLRCSAACGCHSPWHAIS